MAPLPTGPLGADDGGEANLIYSWSATGPGAVSFSPNGTNAAKSSVATFTQAGAYVLQAAIGDEQGETVTKGTMQPGQVAETHLNSLTKGFYVMQYVLEGELISKKFFVE